MTISAFFQSYGVMLALAASAAVLLVLYFSAYVRKQRPKEGTLEWIRMYDRPRFSLTGAAKTGGAELGLALLAGLLSVAGFALRYGISLYHWVAGLEQLFCNRSFLFGAAATLLGGGVMALFVHALVQDRAVSVCAGILYGFCHVYQGRCAVLLLLSLLCLWRWLRQEHSAPLRRTAWWLLASIAFLAMSAVYSWYLLWLIPVYFAAYILKLVARSRASTAEQRGTRAWCSVLLSILCCVAGGIVLWCVVALRLGLLEQTELLRKLLSPAFYWGIVQDIPHLFGYLRPSFSADWFWYARADWPVLLCGGASLIAAAADAFRRRECAGVAIVVLCAALLVLWLGSGTYLLMLGLLPAMAYVWHGLRRRSASALVYVCFALCICYQVITWFYLYF